MPQVLTSNALIMCPHGGRGTTLQPPKPKWTVNNGAVAVEGDTGTLSCPFVPLPCVGYTLVSMGLNATTIDGRKVILVTDFNQTLTGLPLVMADFHQTFDDSTPAPIPQGQPAPAASPEMADFASPKVVTSIPLMVVPLTPPPPAPVTITFTMASDHPLRWILTLISEPQQKNFNITNGWPGASITPIGGDWSTPILTVTVLLPSPFVATLAPGKYHLFLTAVSKRGLNGNAESVLEVLP
jgi:hypothetical protein